MSFPDPKTFIGSNGTPVPDDLDCHYSGTSITVLSELTDKPWDEVSLAYVLALRPTSIRICTTGCKCDAQRGRVTVWMEGDKIVSVEQEVKVYLPDGIRNGHVLDVALLHGKDSPEVKACL